MNKNCVWSHKRQKYPSSTLLFSPIAVQLPPGTTRSVLASSEILLFTEAKYRRDHRCCIWAYAGVYHRTLQQVTPRFVTNPYRRRYTAHFSCEIAWTKQDSYTWSNCIGFESMQSDKISIFNLNWR